MIWTPGAVYGFVRKAGFKVDQWTRATALALATSGGDDLYRDVSSPVGVRDRRGLFGIDALAHPELAGMDLFSPPANARAAYALTLSSEGSFGWSAVSVPLPGSEAFTAAERAVRAGVTGQPIPVGPSLGMDNPVVSQAVTALAGISDYFRSQLNPGG